MQYTRGGKDGTFLGHATVASLDSSTVTFEEQGIAQLSPLGEEYEARQRLLYVASSSDTCVHVLFDESKDRGTVSAIVAGGRAFHTIDLSDAAPQFEHPCGPDLYRGRLALDGEDNFRLLWGVSGPRKLGSVISTFRRTSSSKC